MNRQLGFSTFNTNLLTIPQAVLHIILLLAITWFSEKVNDRAFVALIAPFYALPLIAIIRWWPVLVKHLGNLYFKHIIRWAALHPRNLCFLVSRNSNHVRTRSISSAVYNMFVQLGSIIASNIYRKDDLPLYKRGNMQLFL